MAGLHCLISKRKVYRREALKLNPHSSEASGLLDDLNKSIDKAIPFDMKVIDTGKRKFGGKFLEKNRGDFWGNYEIRPYLCCMHKFANCLNVIGDKERCVSILEEMIDLNSNDNQGVVNRLMLYLIALNPL